MRKINVPTKVAVEIDSNECFNEWCMKNVLRLFKLRTEAGLLKFERKKPSIVVLEMAKPARMLENLQNWYYQPYRLQF